MRRYNDDKKDERHQYRSRSHQISRREREMIGKHATREDADAETQVPCGEIGGRGRAALRIGTQIDEQGIESRKRRAKAQTTTQGYDQESNGRVVRA